MRKSYVYKITCKINDEYYFGSSFNAKSDKYWGGGKLIRERIAQYGKENFVKEILGEFDDRVEAHRVENLYIEQFRNDENCLNIACDHKFGTYGEESRAKMSAANRDKIVSEETRAKLSAALRGKHHTEEVKARISAALCGEKNPMYGKIFSDEHRAKLSAALRGENHPMYGKHISEEHRAKLYAANHGKHRTEETRAKMSASHLGKLRGKHWRKNKITGKREWYD